MTPRLFSLVLTLVLLAGCDLNAPEPDEGNSQVTVTGDIETEFEGRASYGGRLFATPALHLSGERFTDHDLFVYWVYALDGDDAPSVPPPGRYDLIDPEAGTPPRLSFYAYLRTKDPYGNHVRFYSNTGELVIESSDDEEIRGSIDFGAGEDGIGIRTIEVTGSFRALVDPPSSM